MDQSAASAILQHMPEGQAEEITAAIVKLKNVDSSDVDRVLHDFHELSVRSSSRTRGGRDIAAELLEATFGSERAASVMSRVTSSLAGRAFDFLYNADPHQVAMLLDGGLPHTSAVVLAHLRPDQASKVLTALNDSIRTEVAHCVATMTTASPEAVRGIAETLRVRSGLVISTKDQNEASGGVQPLVEMINRAAVAIEKTVLEELESRDPGLAAEIRSRMLTFNDIVKLEDRDVQHVLRGIDLPVLALAMEGSPQPVQEAIKNNLSERNRETLEDELEILGSVRVSKVEEARSEIVRAIRTLEAEGLITVQRSEDEQYVE
ncbi:flagellar motor switch protein FliG [Leifsonia xyli subsp. xyli]|nr:flagellar motor switch protein FliG [Leifsonia xyli subsp. xyli]